jgi:hypothetical protein
MKAATSIQSLKRFVDPKDIAALAVFLASDAGKSISGQVLPIDNDSPQGVLTLRRGPCSLEGQEKMRSVTGTASK